MSFSERQRATKLQQPTKPKKSCLFEGRTVDLSRSILPSRLEDAEDETRGLEPQLHKSDLKTTSKEPLRSSLSMSLSLPKEQFSIYRSSSPPDLDAPSMNCDYNQDKENVFAYYKKDGIEQLLEEDEAGGKCLSKTSVLLPPLRSQILSQEHHANANQGNVIELYDNGAPRGDPVKRNRMKTYKWTQEEDNLIIRYKEERHLSWKRIASLLGGNRTWQAVQMRYLRTHKLRESPWSSKDADHLVESVKRDWEDRWKRIARDLGPSFSPQKCFDKIKSICIHGEDEFQSSQHCDLKKLMLVYLGLDAIAYDSDDCSGFGIDH